MEAEDMIWRLKQHLYWRRTVPRDCIKPTFPPGHRAKWAERFIFAGGREHHRSSPTDQFEHIEAGDGIEIPLRLKRIPPSKVDER